MGDFFHGRRRKVGVVTLVMALVVVAGWGRSYGVNDGVCFEFGNRGHMIDSLDGSITLRAYDPDGPFTPSVWSNAIEPNTTMILGRLSPSYRPIHITIPYCLFVIPLTLLSGYLLLSKPRTASQIKPVEPIAEKVE